jgi:signal transduction histidine kinase
MAAVGVLPVVVMALEGHYFGRRALYDSERGHLGFALQSRAIWLKEWLHFTRNEFFHTAQEHSPVPSHALPGDPVSAESVESALRFLARGHARYAMLSAYDARWNLLAELTDSPASGSAPRLPADLRHALETSDQFAVSSEFFFDGDHVVVPLGQPVLGPDGTRAGYIVAGLDLTHSLRRILGNSSDFGETGRLTLLNGKGLCLVPPSNRPELAGRPSGVPGEVLRPPFGEIRHYRDSRGVQVMGVAAPLEEMGWVLVAQVDEAEAMHWLNLGAVVGMGTGGLTVVAVSLLAFRTSRRLTRGLRELAGVAQKISAGHLTERAPDFRDTEAHELSEAFNHMLDRIEVGRRALGRSASLAAVGELSASIVHEMRNPLAAVKLNLQGLQQMLPEDPAAGEAAGIALEQARRLEDMLSDLLHFGRPLELRRRPVYLQAMAKEILPLVQQEAQEKGVSFRVQDGLGQEELWVDPELLARALTNLLTNAVQWSPPGATVHLAGARVSGASEWFSLSVEDEGPGVPPERRERLFRPFFTTRPGGTGLGLANVRKIVEHHGGTVFLDAAANGGARFTLHLPFRGEAP